MFENLVTPAGPVKKTSRTLAPARTSLNTLSKGQERLQTSKEPREPLKRGEGSWTDCGTYSFTTDVEAYRIFPKGPDGKSRPIWIKRVYLTLRHNETLQEVLFKYYKHQRNYYWSDEREVGDATWGESAWGKRYGRVAKSTTRKIGSLPRRDVQKTLTRMLFDGETHRADILMQSIEGLI